MNGYDFTLKLLGGLAFFLALVWYIGLMADSDPLWFIPEKWRK